REPFKRSSIVLAGEKLFPLLTGKVPSHGSLSLFEQLFYGQWPESRGGVVAPASQPVPVGADGQDSDRPPVPGEDASGLGGVLGREVPEPGGAVVAAAGQPVPVGADGQGPDRPPVPGEDASGLGGVLGLEVPEPGGGVDAPADQPPPVGAD